MHYCYDMTVIGNRIQLHRVAERNSLEGAFESERLFVSIDLNTLRECVTRLRCRVRATRGATRCTWPMPAYSNQCSP